MINSNSLKLIKHSKKSQNHRQHLVYFHKSPRTANYLYLHFTEQPTVSQYASDNKRRKTCSTGQDLHVLVKQDQAERSKNKTEKKVCLQDFAFVEDRREFSSWIWTCVLPLGENTGSWPSQDRTTEPKCLYRSLDSESGIQEVKQELLEGQQIHSPLYLLSCVNKSVKRSTNIYIFLRARQVHLLLGMNCQCWSHENLQNLKFCSQNCISMFNSTLPPCQRPYPLWQLRCIEKRHMQWTPAHSNHTSQTEFHSGADLNVKKQTNKKKTHPKPTKKLKPTNQKKIITKQTPNTFHEEIRHSFNEKYTSDNKELDERPNLSSDILFVLSVLLEHRSWDKKHC